MTSFQATLVNAGFGQLALRDQHGRIAQKWTLGAPKCVIGAHANCNVRCMLPGIADHHLLLVIGSRQIYLRALAPGVDRDGIAVNELVLSSDQAQLAFKLAGHCFEYSREICNSPKAKAFVEEGALLTTGSGLAPAQPTQPQTAQAQTAHAQPARAQAAPAPAAPDSSQRLRFTFVQALERNRDRIQSAGSGVASSEPAAGANGRPAWVEEIVRDALRPVELRLETIAEPINNLERQLRRQRAHKRKRQQARKLSRHAAHETNTSHTQNLIEVQETIQKQVAHQAARLESVNERVGDIVSQLASLERIVSAENVQHQEVISQSSRSGEEIIRLQREMLALVGALETRIDQPPAVGEDAQWRASIERQLEELHQSLGILDEIKSSLDNAVCQNRELAEDLQAHWQAIEEASQRPVVIQSVPVPQSHSPETPAPAAPTPLAAAPMVAAPGVSLPGSLLEAASAQPITVGDGTMLEPSHDLPVAGASEDAFPQASGDFRVASAAPSVDAVALPSWWSDDPVAPTEPKRPSDSAADGLKADGSLVSEFLQGAARPATAVFADDLPNDAPPSSGLYLGGAELQERTISLEANSPVGSDWHPTEYEQETDPRQLQPPWSYAAQGNDDAGNDYPSLDVPQLLTSAIADPLPSQPSALSYAKQAAAEQSYTKPSYTEQTFDEPTFEQPMYARPEPVVPDDICDASHAASRSASELEGQLQRWLTDGYGPANDESTSEEARFGTLAIAPGNFDAAPADDQSFSPDSELDQQSPTARGMATGHRAGDDEYAVSAFSAERLAIDDAEPNLLADDDEALPESEPSNYGPASTYSESLAYDEPVAEESAAELAGAADQLAYQGAERTSETYASPSAYASGAASGADASEESVEDYMRRLLARMRGVSETEVTLPGLDQPDSRTAEPQPRTSLAGNSFAPVANASGDTQPISEAWTEPFDATKYVPRVTAPEKTGNIDALRELANTSARSAINVSARRKHGTAIMIKSGVAFVGLAAGAALVSINGLKVNIGLVATLASFTVALIWGYDALATLRPLLQASRGAKSQLPRPTVEASEETAP